MPAIQNSTSQSPSTTDFFDGLSRRFAGYYQKKDSFQRRLATWQRYINQYAVADGMCLDAGCGPGILSRVAVEAGMSIVGIDASSKMIDLARENHGSLSDRMTFFTGSLPLHDASRYGSADLIICSSVLEYIEDIKSVADDFFKILKPGGTLLVSLPSRRSLLRKMENFAARLVSIHYLKFQRHQFTLEEGRRVFEDAGFMYQSHEFFGLNNSCHRLGLPENSQLLGCLMLLVLTKPSNS